VVIHPKTSAKINIFYQHDDVKAMGDCRDINNCARNARLENDTNWTLMDHRMTDHGYELTNAGLQV